MAVITLCRQKQKVPAGRVVFTTSQDWVVPRGVKNVRVFLVGGGGGLGGSEKYVSEGGSELIITRAYGGCGGGGYTATYNNVPVTPLSTIPVVVGIGGASKPMTDEGYQIEDGDDGGSSWFGELSVQGGKGGKCAKNGHTPGDGGDGGSGGGGGGYVKERVTSPGNIITEVDNPHGTGGEDGGSGGNSQGVSSSYRSYGGSGQGSTTREFGRADGTLYSAGGGRYDSGKAYNAGSGSERVSGRSSKGRDGIVIVEWDAQ